MSSPDQDGPTQAGDQEEATTKAQPQDEDGGDPTAVPGGDSLVEEITPSATTVHPDQSPDEPESSTEGPTVDENHFGGSETGETTATPVDLEQPTGSGMMPSLSEEEGVIPTAPVGESEEAQVTTENTENERLPKTSEPEGEEASTVGEENTSKNQSAQNCHMHMIAAH